MNEILRRLKKIETEISFLYKRIDLIKTTMQINQTITTNDLLKLPDNLRKTMIVILQLKEASAKAVAKQTHRTRGMESIYLNQLTRMGYIEKIKKGRKVCFRILRTI